MTIFDRYVVVDWSAATGHKRGRDSIWIASIDQMGSEHCENPSARISAEQKLRQMLRDAVDAGERVLIGCDFAYGYPAGFAASLTLEGAQPWRAIWRELVRLVVDDEENVSNRFEVAAVLNGRCGAAPGPYWGCLGKCDDPRLPRTKRDIVRYADQGGLLTEYRATERWLRARRRQAQSVWKLAGAGAVGSQTLVGIPTVARLRENPGLAADSAVWPFETGFGPDPTARGRIRIVHAEIWPSIVGAEAVAAIEHEIKDARQVIALARWLRARDAAEELGAYFDPSDVDDQTRNLVCAEEGWVLGAA